MGDMVWTYQNADLKEFVVSPVADLPELMHMQWRKECRGLMVSECRVVARPLHKFFSPHQGWFGYFTSLTTVRRQLSIWSSKKLR